LIHFREPRSQDEVSGHNVAKFNVDAIAEHEVLCVNVLPLSVSLALRHRR